MNYAAIILLIVLGAGRIFAAGGMDKDSAFVSDIYTKLCADLNSPDDLLWPPKLELKKEQQIFAGTDIYYSTDKNKFGYKIVISRGLLTNLIGNDESALAFVLSHELSHILLGHVGFRSRKQPELIRKAIHRSDELEADTKAVNISLEAGYSFDGIINGIENIASKSGSLTILGSLSKGHPPWPERLSHLDKKKKDMWQSLSAFENGAAFLELHKFDIAIPCLNSIVERFPGCYEAYANLGYAKLMKYLNSLEPEDLEILNSGYIITGLHYKESSYLRNLLRGSDPDLWWEAVGDLRYALRLNDSLAFAAHHLGLAYLFSPRKTADLENSIRYFTMAVDLIKENNEFDDYSKACIYNNAGASYLAADLPDSVVRVVSSESENLARKLGIFENHDIPLENIELKNALDYGKALSLISGGEKQKALLLLENIIRSGLYSNPWHKVVREKYHRLCNEIPVRPADFIVNSSGTAKQIFGLTISGAFVKLTDRKSDLLKGRKNANIRKENIIPGKNLARITLADHHIDILASEYIFAIILKKGCKSEIIIADEDTDKTGSRIFSGMSRGEFEKIVKGLNYKTVRISNNPGNYKFYYDLGIAVEINEKENNIGEIVIARF